MHEVKNLKLHSVFEKYGTHPEFLGIQISSPNQRGAIDDTLLHLTAFIGNTEDMSLLIECGAEVDAVGDLGNTPLHLAVLAERGDAIELLLRAGAQPQIANEFGESPLDVARILGFHEIDKRICECLLARKQQSTPYASIDEEDRQEAKLRLEEYRCIKKMSIDE